MGNNNFLYIPTADFKEVQLGLTTKLFFFPGGIPRGTGSKKPSHAYALNPSQEGSPASDFKTNERQATFYNGRDVWTIAIADNSCDGVTITVTVDGVNYTYTLKTAPSEDTDIQIGGSPSATEANIQAALDGAIGDIAAAIVSSNVEVSSSTTTFSMSTSDAAKVTLTEADEKAKWVLQIGGTTFKPNTQNKYQLPLIINGKDDTLYVVALTPSGANKTTTMARFRTVLVNGHAGTSPTAGYGYVYSKNNASKAQISTALQAAFGNSASTAFVLSGDNSEILTMNHVAGAAGNYKYARFGIFNSVPTISLTLGENDEAIIDKVGPGISGGSHRDFKINDAAKTAEVDQDTAQVIFGTGFTGIARTGSFTANQLHNAVLQRLAGGAASAAVDDHYDYVIQGGGSLEVWGIIAVTDSGTVPGQKNLEVIPEALFTGGLAKNLAKAAADGIPCTFTAIAADEGAPVGYSAIYRQVDQG